ncbi:MAG: GTPase, partial [Ilumatobacteraceae bacterium]
VVDCTAADPEGQISAVREVLSEIGASHLPELLVFNKSDAEPDVAKNLVERYEGSVAVSALTGAGIEGFLLALSDRLRALNKIVELLIPYDRGDLLAAVHREGEVVSTHHDDEGVRVRARLADASAGRLSEFVVAPA